MKRLENSSGKEQSEGTALSLFAFSFNPSAVRFRNPLRNRKAEPEPFAVPGPVLLEEPVEDFSDVLLPDSDPVVLNPYHPVPLIASDIHIDVAAFTPVAYRIRYQIYKKPGQLIPVA